jgi:hypothetical protein
MTVSNSEPLALNHNMPQDISPLTDFRALDESTSAVSLLSL